MKYLITILITLFLIAASSGNAGSHCNDKEQIVFNCTAGKKVLSLCMAKPKEKRGDYLQYRFGSLTKPELVYPKDFEKPANRFFYSSTFYSAGWESRIRFAINAYDYIIYSKTTSGSWEKNGTRKKYPSAGVMILKNKKQIGHIQCAEKDRDFNMPDGYLKEEEFDDNLETP